MNNLRRLIFILLFFLYSAGVFVGAQREIRVPEQEEMYQFLENGVKTYDTAATNGVKTTAKENAKMLLLLAIGSLFKPLLFLSGAAMLIKGYFSGFSVMAAMRLYGIKGSLICIPNFLSAAVLIPAAGYYGSINAKGLLSGEDRRAYYRNFFAATIFLGAIFCADAFIKGALSPIFVKWASKLLISGFEKSWTNAFFVI